MHDKSASSPMPAPQPEFAPEAARMEVIEKYRPDGIEDDPELAAIVAFAARLCQAPVSLVSLVEHDRQRFLAKQGIAERETPREVAFCAHTLGKTGLLEVPDATRDPRFADSPLVTGAPHVRYYAGQPLVSEEGASLGTLCVLDTEPREKPLDDFQRQGLEVLAQAAMARLATRRQSLRADNAIREREERLRRVIEGLPQVAWSADAEGRFDYYNKRWNQQIGAPPPSTAAEWQPFLHPEDWPGAYEKWQQSFASGEEYDAEFRMKLADGSYAWMLALAVPVAESAGEPVRWFGTLTDIDEARMALEQRDLLAHELSHRIKNIFAVIIGLASLKVRKTPEHQPFADELTDTLRALSRAHEYVRPGEGSHNQDRLQGMLASLFAPYTAAGGEPGVRLSGADTSIDARAATPLALVFHELATNSSKYGALSAEGGYVTLDIVDEGEELRLHWSEHGGPPAQEPATLGFGSRMVEMSVQGQLGGTFRRRFDASGFNADLILPKTSLARR